MFKGDKTLFRIHLYSDEFEVVNPLGAKKGKHKVSAFYFTLGNIEQKYNSLLRNIHLCLIVRYCFVKKYSYKVILQPLINDLVTLCTEGIGLDVDGENEVVLGGLASISCDNLTAHSLAGYTCSFNHGRICRFCLALHTEIQYKHEESDYVIRTPELHSYHLSAIRDSTPNGALAYGIASKCPFEEIVAFETTNSFPPDVMHDFLEGIIPRLLKLMLKTFHTDRVCLLQTFNAELNSFDWGPLDKTSKPVELKDSFLRDSSFTFPGSAAQKLCLFLKLPLLIGSVVPTDNKVWSLYLLGRSIADVVLARNIEKKWLCVLESYITDFLALFSDIFPGRLTPKFHYLLHYPRLISAYGPLRNLWCMRFEAKHQYFKRIAYKLNNFKNVAKSLATRHQLRQCWELASGDFLKEDPNSQSGTSVLFTTLSSNVRESILKFCGLTESNVASTDAVWKTKSLTKDHMTYAVGNILIIDFVHEEEIPVFFRITHCLRFRSQWLLCGRLHFATIFSAHYHGYIVEDSLEVAIVSPGMEQDSQQVNLYSTEDGDKIVILDYRPCKLKNV